MSKFERQRGAYDRMGFLSSKARRLGLSLDKHLALVLTALYAALFFFVLFIAFQSGEILDHGPLFAAILSAFILAWGLPPLLIVLALRIVRRRSLKTCNAEMGKLYDKVIAYYRSVPGNPFAFEYSDPYTLNALYQIVRMGKADTTKEAVNVLEQSRYQSSMLNLQGRIFEEARGAKDAACAAALFSAVAAIRR